MPFNLIDVNNGNTLVLNEYGVPYSFEDGRAAAAAAAALSEEKGGRFQPRRAAVDPSVWRQREQSRFDSGAYRRPLFAVEDWFRESEAGRDHFAHVSTETPANIAYTENDERGAGDLQTSMRVGRYLERFFPNLPREYRERITREHMNEFVGTPLVITQDAAKIEWVYTNGPSSCMAYRRGSGNFHSGLPVHPTAVYAGPDLAVAYILCEGDDSRVAARAVVWPDRMKFGRVYGDARLTGLLQRQGYTSGDFDGARLNRIVFRDRGSGVLDFVMPYFDANEFAADNGTHLVVSRGGFIGMKNTSGIGHTTSATTCNCCQSRVRVGSTQSVHVSYDLSRSCVVDASWCSECITTHAALITRSATYGGYSLRSAGAVHDGRFYFTNHWDQLEADRIAREEAANNMAARVLEAALAQTARAERREATIIANKMRRLRTVQDGDPASGRFRCPITNELVHWNDGVDVRRFTDAGRMITLRYSRQAARENSARCDVIRYRYDLRDMVILADGRLCNSRSARNINVNE